LLSFEEGTMVNDFKQTDLINYYINKLAPIINQKVRARLLSFQLVMLIELQDLRISDFDTKVTQIRMNYRRQ
jgi:hypothetical protein